MIEDFAVLLFEESSTPAIEYIYIKSVLPLDDFIYSNLVLNIRSIGNLE